MLILLDIGNTAATYARYHDGRFREQGSCLHGDIPKKISKILKSGGDIHKSIIIGSVVPDLTRKITKRFSGRKKVDIQVAGGDLPLAIKHNYKNIKKLGIDRQINLYGAARIYKPPLLIIDYGTAITMDYMDAGGVFKGGMIIPGPELAFQALVNRAARISSRIRLPRKAASFLGRDTEQCLSTGILNGYGAMTDELVKRFREKYGHKFRVLVTGGFSEHLRPFARTFEIMDPDLSMKSLLLLYKSSQKS